MSHNLHMNHNRVMPRMRFTLQTLALQLLAISTLAGVNTAFAAENAQFGYTHMLSTPLNLPAGRLIFGTNVSLGITDFLQVGTNLLADFYQSYNANAKLQLLDFSDFALALTLGFESLPLTPQGQLNSLLPGLVVGVQVMPNLAFFSGANLYTSSASGTGSTTPVAISPTGFVQGASIEEDISWSYNPHRGRIGNVLAAGFTYDFTYGLYGVGVSHYWKGFHLGVHYYPNASQYPLKPIIEGGTVVDL